MEISRDAGSIPAASNEKSLAMDRKALAFFGLRRAVFFRRDTPGRECAIFPENLTVSVSDSRFAAKAGHSPLSNLGWAAALCFVSSYWMVQSLAALVLSDIPR